MMIDIHCHILPNIDDGSSSMETSIEMARIALEDGIKFIIATPHYIEYEHEIPREAILKNCQELNQLLIQKGIELKILPGAEVFISPTIVESYKKGKIISLNDGRKYILIELPVATYPEYTEDIIFEFKVMGITPIIAHIERYFYVKDDFELVFRLINKGALIQVNSTSVMGLFGKEVKNKSIDLIKHRLVHFIASDAHTTRGRVPKISEALEILRKERVDESYIDYILINSQKVVRGEEIEILDPIKKKVKWFYKLKRRF